MSAAAGVICLVKPGEQVRKDQPVLQLHADDPGRFGAALAALDGAVTFAAQPPPPLPSPVIEAV